MLEQGFTDWMYRQALETGALTAYGFKKNRCLVPWSELSEDEQRSQRRIFRSIDINIGGQKHG